MDKACRIINSPGLTDFQECGSASPCSQLEQCLNPGAAVWPRLGPAPSPLASIYCIATNTQLLGCVFSASVCLSGVGFGTGVRKVWNVTKALCNTAHVSSQISVNSPAPKLDLCKSLWMFIVGEAQSTHEFLPSCSTCETGGAGHTLTLSALTPAVMSRGVSRTQIFLPFIGEVQTFWGKDCACLLRLKLRVSMMQLGWKVLVAANRDVLAPKKITILVKNNGNAKQSARLREQSNQAPLWGKSSWWLRKYQQHLDVALRHGSFAARSWWSSLLPALLLPSSPFPRLLPKRRELSWPQMGQTKQGQRGLGETGSFRAVAATKNPLTEITLNLHSYITLISFFLLHFWWFSMIFFHIDFERNKIMQFLYFL